MLKAEKRSMDVKAKKLRREGFITGNVFGKEIKNSIPVKMEKTAVDRLLKTCTKGAQIMLELEGEELDVGEMKVGDTIKVKDLDIAKDEDVHLLTDLEAVVVTVYEHHNAASAEEEAEEENTEE